MLRAAARVGRARAQPPRRPFRQTGGPYPRAYRGIPGHSGASWGIREASRDIEGRNGPTCSPQSRAPQPTIHDQGCVRFALYLREQIAAHVPYKVGGRGVAPSERGIENNRGNYADLCRSLLPFANASRQGPGSREIDISHLAPDIRRLG